MTVSELIKDIEAKHYGMAAIGEDSLVTNVDITFLIERVHTLEKRNERLSEALQEMKSYIHDKVLHAGLIKLADEALEDEGVKER